MPTTPPDAPRFLLPTQVTVGDLTLRRLSAADEDELFEAMSASLEHLRPWMEWTHHFSRATVIEFIERAGMRDAGPVTNAPYVVRDRNGTVLGTCGLHGSLGPDALEIGYWTVAAHVRKGVACLAAAALTAVAFDVPEVKLVEIHHDPANTASGAIPAKLGYLHVGGAAIEQQLPAGTGEHWHWRITREGWASSAGARLLEAAQGMATGEAR